MSAQASPVARLRTQRLLLRPTIPEDAARAYEIQSDWDVVRMLRMARFPADRQLIERWFADHERERKAAEAFRFAIERESRMIGLVDIDGIAEQTGELGYWLERSAWGQGFASEAAAAVINFAFDELGLIMLRSGHASDNPASGRVLTKLGFRFCDSVQRPSLSRGTNIEQFRYCLSSDDRAMIASSTIASSG